MIEPEQHEVAGPPADDTDGEQPVHPATADGRGGIVDEFNRCLTLLVERNGSDLARQGRHAAEDASARRPAPADREPLSHDETEAIAKAVIPPERVERFETAGEVDFAYSLPGVGRLRVNVFR